MNGQTHKTKRLIILAIAFALLAAAALPLLLRAQDGLTLRWSNISSSYGISSGGGYTIAGTSGEVDGGQPLSGDGFQVTGGFWSGVDEPPEWIPPPTPTPTPPPSPLTNQLYLPSVLDR